MKLHIVNFKYVKRSFVKFFEISYNPKLIFPSCFYFYFLFCSVLPPVSGLSGSPVRDARLCVQHQQSKTSKCSQHVE